MLSYGVYLPEESNPKSARRGAAHPSWRAIMVVDVVRRTSRVSLPVPSRVAAELQDDRVLQGLLLKPPGLHGTFRHIGRIFFPSRVRVTIKTPSATESSRRG